MRKYITWRLPFSDIDNDRYLVEIYANTMPESIITLEGIGIGSGGAFSDEESSDNNQFAPVRTRTAQMHIANSEASLQIVDSMIPRDDTKRFVRVWKLDDDGKRHWVKWQGFMGSDSYTQEYKQRVGSIDIAMNGLLMTMGSIEAKQYIEDSNGMSGMMTFQQMIEYCLNTIARHAGVTDVITDYYIPRRGEEIMTKKMNTHNFFSVEDIELNGIKSKRVRGKTLKDILSAICSYMKWVVREQGQAIYFEDVYGTDDIVHYKLREGQHTWSEYVKVRSINMSELNYNGIDHSKSISRGKRYVEVRASLGEVDSIGLPECPYGNLEWKVVGKYNVTDALQYNTESAVMCAVVNTNPNPFDYITTNYYKSNMVIWNDDVHSTGSIMPSDIDEYVANFPNIPRPEFDGSAVMYAGATFARLEIDYNQYKKMQSGLYCGFLYDTQYGNSIFSMRSKKAYHFNEGFINISADVLFGGLQRYNSTNMRFFADKQDGDTQSIQLQSKIYIRIGIGGWHWNGSGWSNKGLSSIGVEFEDNNFKQVPHDPVYEVDKDLKGLIIPINRELYGEVTIDIMQTIVREGRHINVPSVMFFRSLDIKYVRPFNHLLSDDTENRYIDITGFSFDDTETIDTEIATNNGNLKSPSIVFEPDGITPMDGMVFQGEGSEKYKPEQVTLKDMKRYYSSPRRVISLVVSDDIEDIPNTKITGFDGKTYYPLSVKTDWCKKQRTIECYEVGDIEPDTEPENDLPPVDPTAQTTTGQTGSGTLENDSDGDGRPDNEREDDYPMYDPNETEEPDIDAPDGPDPDGPDDGGYDGPDGPDGPDWDGPDGDY